MVKVIPPKIALWRLWWEAIRQAGLEKEFFQSVRCVKDTDLKCSESSCLDKRWCEDFIANAAKFLIVHQKLRE